MKRILAVSLMCAFSAFMLIACEREQGVQAGGEDSPGSYEPAPAPATPGATPGAGETGPGTGTMAGTEIRGELVRVDMANKTLVVKAQNGMEQTLKFNDQTMVMGAATGGTRTGDTHTQVRNLAGKEGSEVTVQWRDEGGSKVATMINVSDPGTTGGRNMNEQNQNRQNQEGTRGY
jgi:hypothetical protein